MKKAEKRAESAQKSARTAREATKVAIMAGAAAPLAVDALGGVVDRVTPKDDSKALDALIKRKAGPASAKAVYMPALAAAAMVLWGSSTVRLAGVLAGAIAGRNATLYRAKADSAAIDAALVKV